MRRVSVNNLGFGGSNAHVILEEAPRFGDRPESMTLSNGINSQDTNGVLNTSEYPDASAYRLYVLTANDETAVKSQMPDLKMYLEKRKREPTKNLMPNLAFTLGQRRSLLSWKIVLSAQTVKNLIEQLESPERVPIRTTKIPKLGFVFTGQGANWQGMGRELFQKYPVYSSAIAAADRHLITLGAPWSLLGSFRLQPPHKIWLTN